MTAVMTEEEKIVYKGPITRTVEGIIHTEPESTIIQEGHMEDKIVIQIELTANDKGSEVNLDNQLEELELHQGIPADKKTDA